MSSQPLEQPKQAPQTQWDNSFPSIVQANPANEAHGVVGSAKLPSDYGGNDGRPVLSPRAGRVVPAVPDIIINRNKALSKSAKVGTYIGGTVIALAAGTGLTMLGIDAVQNVPEAEHAQEAPKTTLEKINDTGRDLANGVITILAKPGSGAEAYGGETIGNKAAVVGPDKVSGTKDDLTRAPESAITYDAGKNTIYVVAAQEYLVEGTKSINKSEFTHVFVTIKLDKDNSLTLVKGQPTIDDFRQALAPENDLDVTGLEAELRVFGDNPGPSVEYKNEGGVTTAKVDEFTDSIGDSSADLSEATLGDPKFDEVANRLDQVAGAAIQDLVK